MELTENMIEFISGQKTTTITFSNLKHINRVKRLYEERADEFKYYYENKDGSITAKFPLKWIKINPGAKPDENKPKREVSEMQKAKMRMALAEYRKNRKKM